MTSDRSLGPPQSLPPALVSRNGRFGIGASRLNDWSQGVRRAEVRWRRLVKRSDTSWRPSLTHRAVLPLSVRSRPRRGQVCAARADSHRHDPARPARCDVRRTSCGTSGLCLLVRLSRRATVPQQPSYLRCGFNHFGREVHLQSLFGNSSSGRARLFIARRP